MSTSRRDADYAIRLFNAAAQTDANATTYCNAMAHFNAAAQTNANATAYRNAMAHFNAMAHSDSATYANASRHAYAATGSSKNGGSQQTGRRYQLRRHRDRNL